MSVSILEALMNADYNLQSLRFNGPEPVPVTLCKQQLHNAVTLLEKGYTTDMEVEPLLEAAGGTVENVPEAG